MNYQWVLGRDDNDNTIYMYDDENDKTVGEVKQQHDGTFDAIADKKVGNDTISVLLDRQITDRNHAMKLVEAHIGQPKPEQHRR